LISIYPSQKFSAQKKTMSMATWIDKLHAFLELNEKEILQGAGKVSKQLADDLALREYE